MKKVKGIIYDILTSDDERHGTLYNTWNFSKDLREYNYMKILCTFACCTLHALFMEFKMNHARSPFLRPTQLPVTRPSWYLSPHTNLTKASVEDPWDIAHIYGILHCNQFIITSKLQSCCLWLIKGLKDFNWICLFSKHIKTKQEMAKFFQGKCYVIDVGLLIFYDCLSLKK